MTERLASLDVYPPAGKMTYMDAASVGLMHAGAARAAPRDAARIGGPPASVARCSTRRNPAPLLTAPKSSSSALCSTARLSHTSSVPGRQRKRKVNSGRVACS